MQRQDSEPLFGDEVYHLLRDDSLLHRTGSANFAALLDPSDASSPPPLTIDQQQHQPLIHPVPPEELQLEQHQNAYPLGMQQQHQQHPPQTQQPQPQLQQQMQQHQQQLQEEELIKWEGLVSDGPVQVVDESALAWSLSTLESGTVVSPDTTPPNRVPSLQPWQGRYSFKISLPTDNKDRNKWCYSSGQRKLYTCPDVAVPVSIEVNDWGVDASVTITPIFKDSRFVMDPVHRCYNHKSNQMQEDASLAEHVVQLDQEGCFYSNINDRFLVTVPLQPPPPGEVTTTLLVKLMCLTSCVGGPNRRPFSLVFTMRDTITGEEIGRQVLEVKCCKCPSRDMGHEEKAINQREDGNPLIDDDKRKKVRKLASELTTCPKRKKPNIKLEPGTAPRTVKIDVPIEFENQVKAYINNLVLGQIIRRQQVDHDILPFPEANYTDDDN